MPDKVEQIAEHLEVIMDILDLKRTTSNKGTPRRVAKMWVNELFVNRNNENMEDLKASMTAFPNKYPGTDLVIVKDIPFSSTCEHHWLPFSGTVTVGYAPDQTVIGLSKIPRVVKYFSRQPQLQEQFTQQIGDFLKDLLHPFALFVEVEAKHQCVMCRGAESDCSTRTNYCHTEKGMQSLYDDFKARM